MITSIEIGDHKLQQKNVYQNLSVLNTKRRLSRIVLRYKTEYLQGMIGIVQNFLISRHVSPYTLDS